MITGIPSYRSPDAVMQRVVALCGSIENSSVLDVGSGDGLIGRALLPRVGPGGSVTFLDRDPSLIQALARDFAGDTRAHAVVDDASELRTVRCESIDLLVMRAVLLYVPDKRGALRSAARVLRPGGRIVISEPVNRPLYYPAERFWGFDLSSIPGIALKLQQAFTRSPDRDVQAMLDWDDLSLATTVSDAGFTDLRMETISEIVNGPVLPWLAFLHARWTPQMPSLAQVVSEWLTRDESDALEQVLRPQLASGNQRLTIRNVFVTASRR